VSPLKQSSHTLYHHLIYFTSMGVTWCEGLPDCGKLVGVNHRRKWGLF